MVVSKWLIASDKQRLTLNDQPPMTYFKDIRDGIRTTLKGLSLTLRHIRNATKRRTPEGIASDNYFDLQNGLVTLQYPYEQLPIPDNGRYRLRNEIDDCIVCDKCAKICPVDCITIDAVKATEEIGRASDGSPIRLYAATFDIDMAKCCYCGLCTVVCPTECLTMDKKFDYSEFDLNKLTYHFSNLSQEQADEKRSLYEQFVQEKETAKASQTVAKATAQEANVTTPSTTAKPAPARPVFRPTVKPVVKTAPTELTNSEGGAAEHSLTDATPDEMERIAQGGLETLKHPTFESAQEPVGETTNAPIEKPQEVPIPQPQSNKPVVAKPAFRPTMKPGATSAPTPTTPETDLTNVDPTKEPKPKPAFRPTMKPPVTVQEGDVKPEVAKAKTAFKPTMKPETVESEESVTNTPANDEPKVAKSAGFRPTMKPTNPVSVNDEVAESETPPTQPNATGEVPDPPVVNGPKPPFRPTMKPKPKPGGEEAI